MKELYVTKASGERELFSEAKLLASIGHAEVKSEESRRILNIVKEGLYENIPTAQIHQLVENYLGTVSPSSQARYQLKRAVMTLGPTGYPFEVYIGELLKKFGYATLVSQLVRGSCVTHEVDVLAEKGERVYFVECKYHNQPGLRTDLKVALYVVARGEDLFEKLKSEHPETKYASWVFTNTKFSADAITYAECKGLRLTGWSYPQNSSLQMMIEKTHLYPITVLKSLSSKQTARLLEQNIVLVSQLSGITHLKELLDLSDEGEEKIKRECLLIEGE
jgi:hypothetical protein